jgi:hypothetical protein
LDRPVVNVVVSEADSAEVAVDVAEAGEEVVDAAEDEENKMTKRYVLNLRDRTSSDRLPFTVGPRYEVGPSCQRYENQTSGGHISVFFTHQGNNNVKIHNRTTTYAGVSFRKLKSWTSFLGVP